MNSLPGRPVRDVKPSTLGQILELYALTYINLERRAAELGVPPRIPPMARVRMWGQEFDADVLLDNGNGTYLMRARERTGRTARGGSFTATKDEIVSGTDVTSSSAAPTVPQGASGAPASPASMMGLPGVPIAVTAPHPSVGETDTLVFFKNPKVFKVGKPAMHLADKMKALSQGAKDLAADVEAKVDAALARQQDVKSRADAAMSKIGAVADDADAGVSAVEEALKGLTN